MTIVKTQVSQIYKHLPDPRAAAVRQVYAAPTFIPISPPCGRRLGSLTAMRKEASWQTAVQGLTPVHPDEPAWNPRERWWSIITKAIRSRPRPPISAGIHLSPPFIHPHWPPPPQLLPAPKQQLCTYVHVESVAIATVPSCRQSSGPRFLQ